MWSESLHPGLRIHLAAQAEATHRQGVGPASHHPLMRRMTPVQKALLDACHVLSTGSSELFREHVVEGGCPVVYASALGEFGSNLAMLGALARNELPLSPTAFQHSVHNCPAGYFSIAYALRNPMTTLCGGFLSAEKALSLGAFLLSGRQARAVLVLAADECLLPEQGSRAGDGSGLPQGAILARAEAVLLVATQGNATGRKELVRCGFAGLPASEWERALLDGAPTLHDATEGLPAWPSLLGGGDGPSSRRLRSRDGEIMETIWILRE